MSAQVVSEVDVVSSSVVTYLITNLGSSSSNSLYIASQEEHPESIVHVISEKNGGILEISIVGGAGCDGTIGFLFYLVALNILLEFC